MRAWVWMGVMLWGGVAFAAPPSFCWPGETSWEFPAPAVTRKELPRLGVGVLQGVPLGQASPTQDGRSFPWRGKVGEVEFLPTSPSAHPSRPSPSPKFEGKGRSGAWAGRRWIGSSQYRSGPG